MKKTPMIHVISRCTIRNKTKNGDLCKQIFMLYVSDTEPEELTLSIRKFVLSDDKELYFDYLKLKTFKDKTLFFQDFGIRVSTFEKAQKLLVENQKMF
jgi:hypothetical protein